MRRLLLRWGALRDGGFTVAAVGWLLARRPHLVDRVGSDSVEGLSLADLRAEYGQSVLDDADRNPGLAELLDGIGDVLLESVRTLEAQVRSVPEIGSPALTRYVLLTELAQRCLSDAAESAAIVPRPYMGYSQPMLLVAAACRLGSSPRLRVG